MKFLGIDDSEDDIELLRLHLEDSSLEGVELFGCPDWETAKGVLESNTIDLVFLDYRLGARSGLEILQLIIDVFEFHPPIIMLTGQGSEEIAVEAIKNGAEDYLVKGRISQESIERTIHNALEKGALKKTILKQEQDLVEAERQRVMMESIGATCHHFAQPLTSVIGYLELLSQDPRLDEDKRKSYFKSCLDAANWMTEILKCFHEVREYRTRPYCSDKKILDVGIDEDASDSTEQSRESTGVEAFS